MGPAHQRLEPDDTPLPRLHHRLEQHMQLILFQRIPQRQFQLAPLLRLGMQLRFIGAMHAAPVAFRPIKGKVRAPDQRL